MKRHIEYLDIYRNYTNNGERNKAITPTSKKKKKKEKLIEKRNKEEKAKNRFIALK